jgi:hypothetical protein
MLPVGYFYGSRPAPLGLQVYPDLAMSVQFRDIVVKSAYGESGE